METLVLMNMEDAFGNNLQLFKSEFEGEITYVISSDFVDVSKVGGGCYWCHEFENLKDATFAIHQIAEHSEKNNGKFDADWLVKTFGMATC